jgi:hypothetical protein
VNERRDRKKTVPSLLLKVGTKGANICSTHKNCRDAQYAQDTTQIAIVSTNKFTPDTEQFPHRVKLLQGSSRLDYFTTKDFLAVRPKRRKSHKNSDQARHSLPQFHSSGCTRFWDGFGTFTRGRPGGGENSRHKDFFNGSPIILWLATFY